MKDVIRLNYPIHANLIYVPPTWLLCYIDGLVEDCSISCALAMEILHSCTKPSICHRGGGGGGGGLHLWESVDMRRGFAPHFQHLDDLFAPQNLTMSSISFRSCWVPFRKPPFSGCCQMFAPKLTKSIILARSCWVPFWTSSGPPLLIFTRSSYRITAQRVITKPDRVIQEYEPWKTRTRPDIDQM